MEQTNTKQKNTKIDSTRKKDVQDKGKTKKKPVITELTQSLGYLLRNTPGFDELPKLVKKYHGKNNK